MLSLIALVSTSPAEAGPDITPALTVPKKAKWDPAGKSMDPYGLGDSKRKQEAWDEGITLLVQALDAQPGCGKCLSSLASALIGAERTDEAVQVGMLMNQLYPDRSDGWRKISDAWNAVYEAQKAVDATSEYLELKATDVDYWWRRNRLLVQLGKFDEATTFLDGAEAAGVKPADVACLRIQVFAAKSEPAAARELWAACDEGENVDLRRYSEGWLALAEGDTELASKRLVLAGADDFARLTIALVRLDQKNGEAALNLSNKLLEENDWAWDGHLAKARALQLLGRGDEALAALDVKLMADGWAAAHKGATLENVLLKPKGAAWVQAVGRDAAALKVSLLVAKGQGDAAKVLFDEAVAAHGESAELTAALTPAAAPAPATP